MKQNLERLECRAQLVLEPGPEVGHRVAVWVIQVFQTSAGSEQRHFAGQGSYLERGLDQVSPDSVQHLQHQVPGLKSILRYSSHGLHFVSCKTHLAVSEVCGY